MSPESLASLALTYGPLGIIFVLFVLGIVQPKTVTDRLEKENAELKAALERERSAAQYAMSQQALSNQLVGELRSVLLSHPPWHPADPPPPLPPGEGGKG